MPNPSELERSEDREDCDDDFVEEYILSQPHLIAAICGYLDRCGTKLLLQRQINAIIEAADIIMAELNRPEVPATPGMGLDAWLRSKDKTTDRSGSSVDRCCSDVSSRLVEKGFTEDKAMRILCAAVHGSSNGRLQ